MIQKEDQEGRPAVGVDVGATLAKLAVRGQGGETRFDLLPAGDVEAIARRVEAHTPRCIGVTGCGASTLEQRLGSGVRRFVEFEAWGRGSDALLRREQAPSTDAYVMVSLGTGTSVLRVEGGRASRLGGTALGGGTVLGLGVALTGCESYDELCRLAESGQRSSVDLLVSDIYQPGEIALPGETTASSFGNLARWLTDGTGQAGPSSGNPSRREDLAASVMGLVGENVALIACGLAAVVDAKRLVYGGATLIGNPALATILRLVTLGMGREPLLLAEGGHVGALGALELAISER